MRRVISLWLPNFPTDRLRRCQWDHRADHPQGAPSPDTPFVTSAHDGHRRVIAAVDAAARGVGLRPGLPLAQAQARLPGLAVAEADPAADAAALARLAGWCLRYAPLTAPDPPDGVWIDVTGATHLAGGEAGLLADLVDRLREAGFSARAAIADTPGAAHAITRTNPPLPLRAWAAKRTEAEGWGVGGRGSRPTVVRISPPSAADVSPPPPNPPAFSLGPLRGPSPQGEGERGFAVVPPDHHIAALAGLSVHALRLPQETVDALNRLGLTHIHQLATAPRAPLTRRFGAVLLRRLDQAMGHVFEPIVPILPPELISRRLTFVEPLSTPEAFTAVIAKLARSVCRRLEQGGLGARRLDLLFERADGSIQALRVGTARPVRNPLHLAKLLDERLETVDPGLGVDAMRLSVPLTEALTPDQATTLLEDSEAVDLSALVDRLTNRLGASRVYRAAPVESDVPERSVQRIPPLAPPSHRTWPVELPRPVRLFSPPQPVRALAPLPDDPPVAFTWRRKRFRIRRADGPERIHGEWWRRDAELYAVRDYFRVEDEEGRRFWLFRRGDGVDPKTGGLDWFLHGIF